MIYKKLHPVTGCENEIKLRYYTFNPVIIEVDYFVITEMKEKCTKYPTVGFPLVTVICLMKDFCNTIFLSKRQLHMQ